VQHPALAKLETQERNTRNTSKIRSWKHKNMWRQDL